MAGSTGPGRVPELALGLRRAEEHRQPGEGDLVRVHEAERGGRAHRRVRDAQPGARAARGGGDRGEEVAEPHVGAAEEVALAGASAFEGERVAGGDVPDVDDVEAGGRDIPEVAPAGDAADHPPGRRGAGVALADGRRRVHDDGAGRERELLRLELRPLVRDGELPPRRPVLLRRGPAGDRAARAGRARVDDPPDACAGSRRQHRFRPFYVHAREGGLVPAVVAVQRGHVDERVAAPHRPLEPGAVEQVDVLVADVGPALAELADDVAADESQPAPGDVDANGPRLRDSGSSATLPPRPGRRSSAG